MAGTKFHVSLGNLKLNASQKKSLNKALSAATLSELARLDLADNVIHRIPPEWLGIVVDRFRNTRTGISPDGDPAIPADARGTTFTVAVGPELKLSSTQQRSLSNAINSATLTELSRMGIKESFAVRIPRKEWLGIWLDRVKIDRGRITGGVIG